MAVPQRSRAASATRSRLTPMQAEDASTNASGDIFVKLACLQPLGRRQAVRLRTLNPASEGSNPSAPAKKGSRKSPMVRPPHDMKIFTGSANRALGESSSRYLKVPLGKTDL